MNDSSRESRKFAPFSGSAALDRLVRRDPISYLHFDHTAGAQLEHVFTQVNGARSDLRIVNRGSRMLLRDLAPTERYFFSVRAPATRFVSGFHHRKAVARAGGEGMRADEHRVFDLFEEANDLAEALFTEGTVGLQAMASMKALVPTATQQIDWFTGEAFFLEMRPPVAILRVEHLADDLGRFLVAIGHHGPVHFSDAPDVRDASSAEGYPQLSPLGRANLTEWFRQDADFYRRCSEWIESR